MPIIATDIIYRLSGGASNTDPALSIGGIKSSTAAGATLYDDVSSAEASAGDTSQSLDTDQHAQRKHRCGHWPWQHRA